METVYVESSVLSYLTARPSRDLLVAAHQQVTRAWWEEHGTLYERVISTAVISEISLGDPAFAELRLRAVSGLRLLSGTSQIDDLTDCYVRAIGLSPQSRMDLYHLAHAVLYGLDYLVTWNLKHIANPHTLRRLEAYNKKAGLPTPVVLTPEVLYDLRKGNS